MPASPNSKSRMAQMAVAAPPEVELPKSLSAYRRMKPTAKEELNARRIVAINGSPLIVTDQVLEIRSLIEEQLSNNRGVRGTGIGVAVEGEASSGKTQAVRDVAYRQYRRAMTDASYRRPADPERDEHIPCVYLVVNGAGPRSLAGQILTNMGIPNSKNDNLIRVTARIEDAFERYGVQLLIIDDVQNLTDEREGREASDFVKGLMETTDVTMVIVGFTLASKPIFCGSSAIQLRSRLEDVETSKFEMSTNVGAVEYVSFLNGLEHEMPLLAQEPESLAADHGERIFELAQGEMTATTQVVYKAARKAIQNGDEKITRKNIDSIRLTFEAKKKLAARTP